MTELAVVGQSAPSVTNPTTDTNERGYQGYTDGVYIIYTYEDGTKELRFHPAENPGGNGILVGNAGIDAVVRSKWLAAQRPKPNTQTPEQQQATQLENQHRQQINQDAEDKRQDEILKNNERSYNQQQTGFLETHEERAARELRVQADKRAEEAAQREKDARDLAAQNQTRANEIAAGNLAVSQGSLAETIRQHQYDESKPNFISADTKTPNIVRYNPQSGQVESTPNPNYDAVKQEAEQLRELLTTQIQAGQLKLEEAKQQYTQWFDTNVKTPLALAQEARDKAAEQRAALDAEERRRQFAAQNALQRGELGQRAGATAIQAEESLLPYRAGPNEAADMSSAINGLAAGGTLGSNAAAGIHFQPSDFEFNAPDFKKIAHDAAKAALSGISSYIPSDEQYQTADYSSVPAVNTSGAPSAPDVSGGFQGILDNLNSHYNFGGTTQPQQ